MAFYILTKPTFGKFGTLDRKQALSDILVDAGSLWQEIVNAEAQRAVFNQFRHTDVHDDSKAYESVEARCLYVICGPDEVSHVPVKWAEMLLGVQDYKERLLLYFTENALYSASRLSIGDVVRVKLANGRVVNGHLRWVGRTSVQKQGTVFGVQVPSGLGMTDGTRNGVRYFTTPRQAALFVPVSLLEFSPSPSPPFLFSTPASFVHQPSSVAHSSHNETTGSRVKEARSATEGEKAGKNSSRLIDLRTTRSDSSPPMSPLVDLSSSERRDDHSTANDETNPAACRAPRRAGRGDAEALPPLHVGERVIFLQDGAAEYGTVRWLGTLAGFPEPMAGVEFDNAIGGGTGMYNGRKLFSARLHHASLMPIEGLIRAVDYDREATDFGELRKNICADFDPLKDTTSWATAQQEPDSESPSPPRADGSGDSNGPVKETLSTNPQHIQIGALVEVSLYINITAPGLVLPGVVRWIGKLPDREGLMVGVELEKLVPYCIQCADGSYHGKSYFTCGFRRGVFVPLSDVRVCAPRAIPAAGDRNAQPNGVLNESMPKFPAPWKAYDLHLLTGKPKGIQGKSNSCYLDATLFALFTASDAFDEILSRPKRRTDVELYDDIRTCLKFQIVSSLRWRGYVEEEAVMKLRRLLRGALPHSDGWTTEEKDPEELINVLFGAILAVDPDIHLTTGQSSYICQLVIEDTFQKTPLTSVQTLLERSFFCSNVMLASVPERFIVQLPRYGKKKLYDYIVPTLKLDLSNVVANRRRECGMCGQPAEWQCKECYLIETHEYAMTFYCNMCFGKFHSALRRNNDHQPNSVAGPVAPTTTGSAHLELASVICIESSHYVSFVRVRDSSPPRWLFFDSMADREGGDITGRNLPQVSACDEYFDALLRPQNHHLLVDALPSPVDHPSRCHDRSSWGPLPPYIIRLLRDCYTCVYVRPSE